MRFKFTSRCRTLAWCLHLFGRHLSCVHHLPPDFFSSSPPPPQQVIVIVVGSDSGVKVYSRSLAAAELMADFPMHLICNSDSFFIGQQVPVLSETDELKLGQRYFLLPRHFFQSVLSFASIASIAVASAQYSRPNIPSGKKAAACSYKPAFDVVKTSSGSVQIKVSDEFMQRLTEKRKVRVDGEEEAAVLGAKDADIECWKGGLLFTTPQLQKDYSQLVGWRRSAQWRPKLDAIREERGSKFPSFGVLKLVKERAHHENEPTKSKWKPSPLLSNFQCLR